MFKRMSLMLTLAAAFGFGLASPSLTENATAQTWSTYRIATPYYAYAPTGYYTYPVTYQAYYGGSLAPMTYSYPTYLQPSYGTTLQPTYFYYPPAPGVVLRSWW